MPLLLSELKRLLQERGLSTRTEGLKGDARLQALEDTRSKLEKDLGANLSELEATRERLEAARLGEQSLGETLEEQLDWLLVLPLV